MLATHHFSNLEKSVIQMDRIAKTGAIVFLTFDPRARLQTTLSNSDPPKSPLKGGTLTEFSPLFKGGRGGSPGLQTDPRVAEKLWIADYFPVYREYDFHVFPPLSDVTALIQAKTQRTVEISTLMLPHDLTDMFAAAGWRRPEIYLNPDVRAGISALALADASVVEKGVSLLEKDLNSGRWDAKYGEIGQLTELDAGYRFLCARVPKSLIR